MSETVARQSAPPSDEVPSVAALACEACGGIVEADDKFCPTCGKVLENRRKAVQTEPQKHFRCKNCGAEVSVDPKQRSYVCPFCDSTYVVEFAPQVTGRQGPEFVIGFAVSRDKAQEIFRSWINEKSWFRPADLKPAILSEKLKGVYVPFWSFSMMARSNWDALIGEYWYRTESYTVIENGKSVRKTRTVRETEWWPLKGKHHDFHSGYLISGSRGLAQELADRIGPFHLTAMRRYEPYYLAGWACEEYSVDRAKAESLCRQVFMQWEKENIESFLPGDTHRLLDYDVSFHHPASDLILLPIYLLTYTYGDETYHFLINGQTGKSYGTKPVSWHKLAVAVGSGILAVLLLVLLLITLANML